MSVEEKRIYIGELCNGSTTDSAYRVAVYCQARRSDNRKNFGRN